MPEEDRRIPIYKDIQTEEPPLLKVKKKTKKRGTIIAENDSLKDLLIFPDIIEEDSL